MVNVQLAKYLKQQVREHGDYVLCSVDVIDRAYNDQNLVNRIGIRDLFTARIAIKEDIFSLYDNYDLCDVETIDKLLNISKKHRIRWFSLLRVSDAFAYALDIDIESGTLIPTRRVDVRAISDMVSCVKCGSEHLSISPVCTEIENLGYMTYGIRVRGRFTEGFRAGVMCVRYYTSRGKLKGEWNSNAVYSVPLCVADREVEGVIYLDIKSRIHYGDHISRILLSFENADIYNFDNVSRIKADGWYKIVE